MAAGPTLARRDGLSTVDKAQCDLNERLWYKSQQPI